MKDADPAIHVEWMGGNCPVQAEGTIGGEPFYFRARGEHWSMSIGGRDVILEPKWRHEEPYPGGQFDAGWMPQWEALGFIAKAVCLYAAATRTSKPEFNA